MDFASRAVGTEAPHFVDLGIPTVNTSDKVSIFGTPVTRLRMPPDRPYWSAPDHIFGKYTAVGMSVTRSELDCSHKTDFKIGGEIMTLSAKIFK